ncbi:MAG: transcriptional regulator, TetR family [Frankiales bacterium]|nr:transcriptional regulator, TetR family [Frankiales bacterium]
MSALPAGSPNRRDRLRAETVQEIKDTARRVLVQRGVDGLSLRAVAREMGMTAPALYRYFSSRENLVENIVVDLYDELCAELGQAVDAARPATPPVQLLAASRAFRRWATTRRAEFGLLFGSAGDGLLPDVSAPADAPETPVQEAAGRFGGVFGGLVAAIYLERPFPTPAEKDLDPALRAQLVAWCRTLPVELPIGAMRVFLSCWIRLYGMVCMEVFGHLKFALDDAESLFEDELRQLAELLGVADAYATVERA